MKLRKDIQRLIVSLREQEQEAKAYGNNQLFSGICLARVELETLIERHAGSRPHVFDGEVMTQQEVSTTLK